MIRMVNYKTNIKTCSKVKNNIQFYFHQSLPLHNKLNTKILKLIQKMLFYFSIMLKLLCYFII